MYSPCMIRMFRTRYEQLANNLPWEYGHPARGQGVLRQAADRPVVKQSLKMLRSGPAYVTGDEEPSGCHEMHMLLRCFIHPCGVGLGPTSDSRPPF